jgi:hypothetical protein
MNASHASHVGPINPHPAGRGRVQRTVLLVMYAALAAQLAIWGILASHVGLSAAFTQAHRGTEADVVVGGAIWLFWFTLAVVLATVRYRRYWR